MSQLVINVDVTVGDGANPSATIKRVEDSMQNDITNNFLAFCKLNNLPVSSQVQIEHAAGKFVEANKNLLP